MDSGDTALLLLCILLAGWLISQEWSNYQGLKTRLAEAKYERRIAELEERASFTAAVGELAVGVDIASSDYVPLQVDDQGALIISTKPTPEPENCVWYGRRRVCYKLKERK